MIPNDREYFDDPEERFTCPRCRWSGPRNSMAFEIFDALFEIRIRCPACGRRIGVVSYPTENQVREAARAGNAEAIRTLERIEGRRNWDRSSAFVSIVGAHHRPFVHAILRCRRPWDHRFRPTIAPSAGAPRA
jgi:hypothetical protein